MSPQAVHRVPDSIPAHGACLVITSSESASFKYAFEKSPAVVGRAADADVRLDAPTVSRHHVSIEQKGDDFFIHKLTQTNRVDVNGHALVSEKCLQHGDQIYIHPFVIRFEREPPAAVAPQLNNAGSEAKQDADATCMEHAQTPILLPRLVLESTKDQPRSFPITVNPTTIGRATSCTIVLPGDSVSREHASIIQKDDFFYIQSVAPSNPTLVNGRRVTKATRIFRGDELTVGSHLLIFLSERTLDQPRRKFADPLRVAVGVSVVIVLMMACYIGYLILLPTEPAQVKPVAVVPTNIAPANNNEADRVRLRTGQSFEKEDPKAAMIEYLAIQEGSPFYEDAQKAISRLWVNYQQQKIQALEKDKPTDAEEISRWLTQADEHFQNKRFLSPVNRNAYALYRMVLAREPNNAVAMARIELIKDFYATEGERQCSLGNTDIGTTYFNRYLIVAPDDRAIRDKLSACTGRKLANTPKIENVPANAPIQSVASKNKVTDIPKDRTQVKQILEKSGADSEWIMNFLFEEGGASKQETPW